jgi:CheY-like chemotaxis protein
VKVLLVDDHTLVRRGLAQLLSTVVKGAEVSEAADSDEAIEVLKAGPHDVALVDIRMPGRDGLELTRAIKAAPELAGIHVILLTAHGEDADVQAGRDAGADLFLTKPFSPLQLLTAVERALGLP